MLRESVVPWEFRYLAGRPDRALTHLARVVDAALIVVGTRAHGGGARMREFFEGSVAVHLAHHQHRPVLTVPLQVVDWKEIRAPWAG
jgi:nucleotide-binding universal stress UspA family protein